MGITMMDVMQMVARIIVLCIAFPVHECAHAVVANKLGDPTAKNLGRIDLNPFAHMKVLPAMVMILLATVLDVVTKKYSLGNMVLLFTSIFFFKAVPIDTRYFKNRKTGMALTAIAGPGSNILLGLVFLIFQKLIFHFAPVNTFFELAYSLFGLIISINLQLAAFNLLPIPPMDGSRVLQLFLSNRMIYKMEQYSNYIMIGVVVLLYATPILDKFIYWGYTILYYAIDVLTGFVDVIGGLVG